MLKYNIRKNFFIKNKNYNCLKIINEENNFIIFDKIIKSSFYPIEKKGNINIISCIYNLIGEKIFYIKNCGIISRLDFETKGIFLILKKEIKLKKIKKKYLAISKCYKKKCVFYTKGYIKKKKNRIIYTKKKTIYPVFTKFIIKTKKRGFNVIVCKFSRGKTHQIRSSLNYLSIRILGDKKYGFFNKYYQESNLHSWNLNFYINNNNYNYYSFPNRNFIKYFFKINFPKFKI
ncbi:pseudouridine synthase [Candidatus Vidania fulgoroideae]|nr:pseudouridine synthase [Candidatus Vidania fulgoroideae]